ncbi:MAG: ZIP family metal transporter, partial [Oscillospiraceae bacterium]|nr:ZIP family metal transporter [Oscillospiraceae bacterium]
MDMKVVYGVLIPFIGTSLGAACVFFMKDTFSKTVQRILEGFAAGVMVAASVWSLLIPSLEQSEHMGKLSFIPAAVGFLAGIFFLLILDNVIPHLHMGSETAEGPQTKLKKTTMLVLAVTLHNIPEGMAVGVVLAGFMADSSKISYTGALALALG